MKREKEAELAEVRADITRTAAVVHALAAALVLYQSNDCIGCEEGNELAWALGDLIELRRRERELMAALDGEAKEGAK